MKCQEYILEIHLNPIKNEAVFNFNFKVETYKARLYNSLIYVQAAIITRLP